MKTLTHAKIVESLIGEIHPVGSTHIDNKRFENLKDMCELVNYLITEIHLVSENRVRHEHSMKQMGDYAHNFLTKQFIGL